MPIELGGLAEYGALIFVMACVTAWAYMAYLGLKYVVDRWVEVGHMFNETDEQTIVVLNKIGAQLDAQNELNAARVEAVKGQAEAVADQAEALRLLLKETEDSRKERQDLFAQAVGEVDGSVRAANLEQTETIRTIIEDAIGRYTQEIEARVERIERMPERFKEMLRAATEETRTEFSRSMDTLFGKLKPLVSGTETEESNNGA